MSKIILITGGQRSGKSRKAEELALSLSENPVYVATAHIWDEEFAERVRKHQEPIVCNTEKMYKLLHQVTGMEVSEFLKYQTISCTKNRLGLRE